MSNNEVALEGDIEYGNEFTGNMYVLETQVQKSIGEMPWLTEADNGMITLALQYAKRIDNALRIADNLPGDATAQVNATKALYLGPHLVNCLKELGGTPGSRLELEAKRKAIVDPKLTKEEDKIASFLADNLVKVAARARSSK